MKIKKMLLMGLSFVLVAALAIGGTVAYLTSSKGVPNVMVVGNISIVQNEQDRDGNNFVQGQTLMPLVTPTGTKDNAGYPACDNYIDKIVTVTNDGKNDAYVRTFIAIPDYTYEGIEVNNASASVIHWNGYSEGDAAPNYPVATRIPGTETDVDNHWYWGQKDKGAWPGNGGDWNMFSAEIDGQKYVVYVITHTTALKAGDTTAPNMIGLYLDSRVDFDGTNYTIDGKVINGFDGTVNVLVASQAVQADGFSDAWTALEEGFGTASATNNPFVAVELPVVVDDVDALATALNDGKDTYLNDDVAVSEQLKMNGGLLNGKGNTITSTVPVNKNGNSVPAILATEGTIENLSIIGSGRGVGTMGALTGDLVVNNYTADGGSYALHVGSGNGYSLTVTNSNLNGWTSYGTGFSSVTFTNCKFAKATTGSNYVRAYSDTVFTNCEFDGTELDLADALVNAKGSVTLDNCTYKGEKITSENLSQLVKTETDRALVIVK